MPLLLLILLQNPEPIICQLGDPVIELKVAALDGSVYRLEDVVNNSLCFFVSPNCGYCREGLKAVESHLAQAYHCVLLLVDAEQWDEARLQTFIPPLLRDQVYRVADPAQLKPHKIKTLPALLAYKDSRLRLAFHGPIDQKACNLMDHAYRGTVHKSNRSK